MDDHPWSRGHEPKQSDHAGEVAASGNSPLSRRQSTQESFATDAPLSYTEGKVADDSVLQHSSRQSRSQTLEFSGTWDVVRRSQRIFGYSSPTTSEESSATTRSEEEYNGTQRRHMRHRTSNTVSNKVRGRQNKHKTHTGNVVEEAKKGDDAVITLRRQVQHWKDKYYEMEGKYEGMKNVEETK